MQALSGSIALVSGQQSYAITFSPGFAAAPTSLVATVQMPGSSGEVFEVAIDRSSITTTGATLWLNGIPTASSDGGYINWRAELVPVGIATPTGVLVGNKALVDGQQSYAITFSPPYLQAPTSFLPSVQMPGSSGEVFTASADLSTLTTTGVTVWLSGIPTAASTGGYINWRAEGVPTGPSNQVGMTVPQLFHRMARRTRGGDFTRLSMTEQTDLAEAANAALQRLYQLLPNYFKELTEGFVLRAPTAITGVAVTQHSKTVTIGTFTRAQIGSTVQLDGDPQYNQIIGTETLLSPYMGPTGIVAGTVYGDAIYSDIYPLERIIGNPQFPNNGAWPFGPITKIGGIEQSAWYYQNSIGAPRVWWTQTLGNSQGNSPMVIIKLAPLPDIAYPVNVRLSFWPKRLTLSDYQDASTLVVPPQFLETALIPLALEALMSSPIWVMRGDEDRVWQNAREAEKFIRSQAQQIGAPNNRVFTPYGY